MSPAHPSPPTFSQLLPPSQIDDVILTIHPSDGKAGGAPTTPNGGSGAAGEEDEESRLKKVMSRPRQASHLPSPGAMVLAAHKLEQSKKSPGGSGGRSRKNTVNSPGGGDKDAMNVSDHELSAA